jgi:hypothetical protein
VETQAKKWVEGGEHVGLQPKRESP